MSGINDVASANRVHIGIFGKTNSGKSTLVNCIANQRVSVVSDIKGTTTDLVNKPMEIHGIGACVIMDTPGFDDDSSLGKDRIENTELALEKTDIAIIVLESTGEMTTDSIEYIWYKRVKALDIPVIFVINKMELDAEYAHQKKLMVEHITKEKCIPVSAQNKTNIEELIDAIKGVYFDPDEEKGYITQNLVTKEDVVLLVMPQDIQAPEKRLILPQVQTLRELLDKHCVVISVSVEEMTVALDNLIHPPKLIITDSQVFEYVYRCKPKESMLTSFSVLMAAYKGDINCYLEGAKALDSLTKDSRVLIAECCTHAPLSEDIGTVKIPGLLRNRVGEGITIEFARGNDFIKEDKKYDLIIQCGGCMFNRRHILSRINKACEKNIPITNYGIAIAHFTGILDKIVKGTFVS